jgi:predicted CXXCH cytochrome family protein
MFATLFRKPIVRAALAALVVTLAVLPFFFIGQAQASPQAQTDSSDCASCHPDVVEAWQNSMHSSTRTDHVLEESTNCTACHPAFVGGQGVQPPANFASVPDGTMQDSNCLLCHTTGYNAETRKSDSYGVTCAACHPQIEDHPNKHYPKNADSSLCGKCHSDTRFNWDNWKNSRHYRENMNCAECHDPHTTTLRNTSTEPTADKSALCISCHEPNEHMSPFSTHGRANVSCVDCHLGEKNGIDAFHMVPNHSFKPEIKTCNNCHATTIHRPAMPNENLPAAIDPRPSPTPYTASQDESPAETPDKEAPKEESKEPPAATQLLDTNSQMWLFVIAGIIGLMGVIVGIMIPIAMPMIKKFLKLP